MPEPNDVASQRAGLAGVTLQALQDFLRQQFSFSAKPGFHPQAYELADMSQESRLIRFNDYIKFFSQPVGVLNYFRKIFDYGSQL